MRILAIVVAITVMRPVPAPAGHLRVGDVPDGIVRLLEDRGRAMVSEDRDLFASGMAPGPFRDGHVRAFDNAAPLTFAAYTFTPVTQYAGDIASARVRGRYPGKEVKAFQVEEASQIAGYDLLPYLENDWWTFVRDRSDPSDRYEGWRLASGSDFEELGAFSSVRIWDGGPVASASSEHFLLLTHPGRIAEVQPALELAERALADVRRYGTAVPDPRYVLVVPSTTDELRTMLQLTVDLSKFVAFAAGSSRAEQDGYEPAGVRLFAQLSHFERYGDSGQRVILAHELIHALTRPVTGPFMPTWFEEGLAMHGSEIEDPTGRVRRGRTPSGFPTDDRFYVGTTSEILRIYEQSQTIVATFLEVQGFEALMRFYEALGRMRLTAGTQEHQVRTALREATGWTLEDWTTAWLERVA